MIKIEKTEVLGFEQAIRGMRNPMNSWEKSDSYEVGVDPISDRIEHVKCTFQIRPNDHELMMKLAKAGPVHGKCKRMIMVYMDIIAPLYWWKEFDTYDVGTVANSCSTMHKIHDKEFTLDDFSHEHLISTWIGDNLDSFVLEEQKDGFEALWSPLGVLEFTIKALNASREAFLKTNDKKFWWQMIQLLPASYNQKRTVILNYEVLTNIYEYRTNHKLDEWHVFCKTIEGLPYSELITGENV